MQYRPIARIGQDAPATDVQPETLSSALAKITPAFILGGIAAGLAFAIGNIIAARWILPDRRRR